MARKKYKSKPPQKRKAKPYGARWPVEKVNWKLTNDAIARQFGVSYTTVWKARKALNKPPVKKLFLLRWPVEKVNWAFSNAAIARQFGIPDYIVRKARKALKKSRPVKRQRDWTTVDWTQSDQDIALRIGCTCNLVARRRTPRVSYGYSRWPVEKADWKLTSAAIARKFGISRQAVSLARRALHKPPPVEPQYDWASVDWTQSNTTIAHQLGCAYALVARHRLPGTVYVSCDRFNSVSQRIMRLLAQKPMRYTEIYKSQGLKQQTASIHLKQMRLKGDVMRRGTRKYAVYSLTTNGRRKLLKRDVQHSGDV